MAGFSTTRKGHRSRRRQAAEINVTPMVDVMLVLLVIFMVTAPMLTVGIPIDLPQTSAKPLAENTQPLTISIDKNSNIFLQESATTLEGLVPRLKSIADVNPETRIFVRGDQHIAYGTIMTVMSALNAAGYRKVALLTKIPKQGPQSRK